MTLQVVYNNYMAAYYDFLALDNKLKTHQRHLHFLAIEIYKYKNTLNSQISCEILYLLRRGIFLSILKVNTQKHGINSLTFREGVLWNSLPIISKISKLSTRTLL